MAPSAQSPGRLRFESFELDLCSGEVWRDGTRLRLQDQPFQVLRVLLERRGEIVTREELKQKTAYEISECDWSSDVCSSDLSRHALSTEAAHCRREA